MNFEFITKICQHAGTRGPNPEEQAIDELVDQLWSMTPAATTPSGSASMTRRSSVSNGTLTLANNQTRPISTSDRSLPQQTSNLELVNERLGRLGLVQPASPEQRSYRYSYGSPSREHTCSSPRAPGILAYSKYNAAPASAASSAQCAAQTANHVNSDGPRPNGYAWQAGGTANKRGRTPPPPPARGVGLAKSAVTGSGAPDVLASGVAVAAVARASPFGPVAVEYTSSVSSPVSVDSGFAIQSNGNGCAGAPLSARSQASSSQQTPGRSGRELHELLESLGLEQYAPLLEQHALDVDTLRLASDEQLERIGLPLGACIRLTSALGVRGGGERRFDTSSRERLRSPRIIPTFSASPAPDLQC